MTAVHRPALLLVPLLLSFACDGSVDARSDAGDAALPRSDAESSFDDARAPAADAGAMEDDGGGSRVDAAAEDAAATDAGPTLASACEDARPMAINTVYTVPAWEGEAVDECSHAEDGASVYFTVEVPDGAHAQFWNAALRYDCASCPEPAPGTPFAVDDYWENETGAAQELVVAVTAAPRTALPDGMPVYVAVEPRATNSSCTTATPVSTLPTTLDGLTDAPLTTREELRFSCPTPTTYPSFSRAHWYAVDVPAGRTLTATTHDYEFLGSGGTPPSVYVFDDCAGTCLASAQFVDFGNRRAEFANDGASTRRVYVAITGHGAYRYGLTLDLAP